MRRLLVLLRLLGVRGGEDIVEEHLRIIQVYRRVEALVRCLICGEYHLLLLLTEGLLLGELKLHLTGQVCLDLLSHLVDFLPLDALYL